VLNRCRSHLQLAGPVEQATGVTPGSGPGLLARNSRSQALPPGRPIVPGSLPFLVASEQVQLFGVGSALRSSSSIDLNQAQALADPTQLVTLARGLKARVVAAGPDDNVGPNSDQMVLWPPSHPTHLGRNPTPRGVSWR
jgi:hypothetical protein